MTSLPEIVRSDLLVLTIEPKDEVRALVRSRPDDPWARPFFWLVVEMRDDLGDTWLAHLYDRDVQREIHAVLSARAERDRLGLSGEEHNITWRWIVDERRSLRT